MLAAPPAAAPTTATPTAAAPPRFDRALGVVSHVPHWPGDGTPGGAVAYEPYVRELRVWARLFAHVEVLAPAAEGPVAGHQVAYGAPNIRWTPVRYSQSYERDGQVARLFQLPALALAIARLARRSDVLLLRSPGHPALVGRPIADLLRVPHVTKWAGYFGPYEGERLPSRVERRLVARHRAPVLVYGEFAAPHLLSFPPALMTDAELAHAAALGAARTWTPPWRILAVGRLLDVKNFDLVLRGLARLHRQAPALPWTFTLVGDGPEEAALRRLAHESGIADRVCFAGALPFEAVQRHYAAAHVVVMPGVKEGWPKIIAEAWAHGAVPVAAAAGIVPWIMAGAGGSVFEPEPDALADCLARLLADPDALAAAGGRGPALAAELSLDAFEARVAAVVRDRLGVA